MTHHIGPLGPKTHFDPMQKAVEEPVISTEQKNATEQNTTVSSPKAGHFMETALERLHQMSVVNPDKVAAAKAKIASGQLGILQGGESKAKSAENIAEALLHMDSILPKG
jgi:anti-sigma28 factor (negative regulator of flagellin synthesis)